MNREEMQEATMQELFGRLNEIRDIIKILKAGELFIDKEIWKRSS